MGGIQAGMACNYTLGCFNLEGFLLGHEDGENSSIAI
jgi:hypothetical protein